MDRHHNSHEAFRALHEARMQHVRASAVAAARNRRSGDPGLIRRISNWMASRPGPATPEASAQSFFWN